LNPTRFESGFGDLFDESGPLCPDGLPQDIVNGELQACPVLLGRSPGGSLPDWFSQNSGLVIGIGVGLVALAMLKGRR
jgi:hypothetical protein